MDYVEQKFEIYSAVFFAQSSSGSGLFVSEQKGDRHGPRINKFIRVILRLIKKTFAKWWNKCINFEYWMEYGTERFGKYVEVSTN